jgi:hypothetical protein
MNINPFNITKAVDYSDEEINKYWVDFPTQNSFSDIIKPNSSMPMLVIGGKGSGKTHIMKYFSYNLQKIRYKENLETKIQEDKYLGIYWRCSGLNTSRFINRGVSDDAWESIFRYYMELWIAQLLLKIIEDISETTGKTLVTLPIIEEILNLFDSKPTENIENVYDLNNYLQSLQKKVDSEVNNLAFNRNGSFSEDFKITIGSGKLIFGLPQILARTVPMFKDIQFLYLIDEYDNLEEYQQKYFNTLLREKEFPTTFKIGVRLYGMKTYQTFSGGEPIREGSEFELFNIDKFLREQDHKKYNEYILNICTLRLKDLGYDNLQINFKNFFEEFNWEIFNKILLEKNINLKHIEKLIENLTQLKLTQKEIEKIINNIEFKQDFIIEKTNILLLYRHIKKNGKNEIDKEALRIHNEALLFFEQKDKNLDHARVLEKYRNDIIDQICRENNYKIPYIGFDKFVELSAGIPRVLLKILKEIYKQSAFNGEKPFQLGSKISAKSQHKGLQITSEWFLEDSPISTKLGLFLRNIGTVLRELRFSNLPPECSICIFSVRASDLNVEEKEILDLLVNHSYLIIENGGRREKNGHDIKLTYQINPVIAPIWELAVSKRGVVSLNKSEVDAIFGNLPDQFDELKREKSREYNFPFKNNISPISRNKTLSTFQAPTLFDNANNH